MDVTVPTGDSSSVSSRHLEIERSSDSDLELLYGMDIDEMRANTMVRDCKLISGLSDVKGKSLYGMDIEEMYAMTMARDTVPTDYSSSVSSLRLKIEPSSELL